MSVSYEHAQPMYTYLLVAHERGAPVEREERIAHHQDGERRIDAADDVDRLS